MFTGLHRAPSWPARPLAYAQQRAAFGFHIWHTALSVATGNCNGDPRYIGATFREIPSTISSFCASYDNVTHFKCLRGDLNPFELQG